MVVPDRRYFTSDGQAGMSASDAGQSALGVGGINGDDCRTDQDEQIKSRLGKFTIGDEVMSAAANRRYV